MRAGLLLAGLGLIAAPAAAQTLPVPPNGARVIYPVIGSVPDICILGEPTTSNESSPINVRPVIGRVIQIEELMEPETLSTQAASIEIAFDAICNYPYRVTLESDNNGLFRQTAGADIAEGFANGIPYNAVLRWDTQSLTIDANALSRRPVRNSFSSDEPTAGQLLLRLQILPGATNVTTRAPLLAGDYGDVLRITVGPQ